MINARTSNPDLIHVSTMDVHGGRDIYVSVSNDVVETINWVRKYRQKLEKEIELRASNPALASAWDQYQVMLRIVMDDI